MQKPGSLKNPLSAGAKPVIAPPAARRWPKRPRNFKGLDQLTLLPDTPERQRQELEFWSALGAVLIVVKGHAAPETGQADARGRALWEALSSSQSSSRSLAGNLCTTWMRVTSKGQATIPQAAAQLPPTPTRILRRVRAGGGWPGMAQGAASPPESRLSLVRRNALSGLSIYEVIALT
jgi:hypothetical protein